MEKPGSDEDRHGTGMLSHPTATALPRTACEIGRSSKLGKVTSNKIDNLRHARDMVLRASRGEDKKADIIVLPEIFNSPNGHKFYPTYAEEVPAVEPSPSGTLPEKSETLIMLREVARETGSFVIGGSIPERDVTTNKLYNCCTVWDPQGRLIAKHRKMHLFDIDIPDKITFKESATISAGSSITTFDTPFGKIGIGICYDIRFPEMAMIASRKGCIAMIYPSAFSTHTGALHWKLLQQARAIDNQIYVSMCSPARDNDAAFVAYGHSMVVDPMGQVLVEAGEEETIVYAIIDRAAMQTARANIPVTQQRRFDVYADVSERVQLAAPSMSP